MYHERFPDGYCFYISLHVFTSFCKHPRVEHSRVYWFKVRWCQDIEKSGQFSHNQFLKLVWFLENRWQRARSPVFDKATRDDFQWNQFDHPLIFERLCEHCSISDSRDMSWYACTQYMQLHARYMPYSFHPKSRHLGLRGSIQCKASTPSTSSCWNRTIPCPLAATPAERMNSVTESWWITSRVILVYWTCAKTQKMEICMSMC